MRNIKFRSYYIYLYILLFKLYLSYGKDFYITSNSTYFDSNSDVNIDTLINNESQNEAINLYFMDDLYDFSIKFNNDINIYNDINIIGMSNNGTIFDFKNTRKGSMLINYSSKSGYKILFKNIIFQNFNSNGDEKVSLFQMTSTPVEQKIYFEDCIFQNNNCILIKMQRHNGCDINLEEEKFSTISLDNCYFYNNRELLFYIIMKEVTALALESLCQRVIINNSRFEYNDNIIRLQSGNLFINNSTFNNNYSKKNEATAQFIDSYGYKNKVIVKDSQISNIKLVDDLPLIFIKKSYMKIYNCRINNIVGSYYHMIRIKIAPTIELEKNYIYQIRIFII
ncbi:hypothetical protein LY90DRAFT_185739 [Neocallimastix californiae]|uniref:Right handed beta helix domain-containing protein n=1 Tax=Neocallimastix californiae TaxID=1754190 RepID=A0A1Y2EN75_9FUNG|nr:hypothetical protein LY90DRAFT_185739 [Neocallimastix californiae]|eukprot:ORY73030.1 hypothetical protein LY90DRAFT_185739 [Neocallimastix californiae]